MALHAPALSVRRPVSGTRGALHLVERPMPYPTALRTQVSSIIWWKLPSAQSPRLTVILPSSMVAPRGTSDDGYTRAMQSATSTEEPPAVAARAVRAEGMSRG